MSVSTAIVVITVASAIVASVVGIVALWRQARTDLEEQSAQAFELREAATGGPAAEIEKASQLLEKGIITKSEFDAIKAKALEAV